MRGFRPATAWRSSACNHRGFLDATLACGKLGARALYLNTDFAGPQVREVCAREGIDAVVYDEEFAEMVDGAEARRGSYVGWVEQGTDDPSLEELIAAGSTAPPPKPSEKSSVVMLTSGTTGTPKGAPREAPRSLGALGALLSKIPFRAGESTCVGSSDVPRARVHPHGARHGPRLDRGHAPPLRRGGDARDDRGEPLHRGDRGSGDAFPHPRARPRADQRNRDLSSLRIIFCGGAQLEADLATRTQDTLGDVLYNLYGSTEVAYATIATPEDLRAAPGCAGKPPIGTTVRLFDEAGRLVEGVGETGRIFVGNGFEFGGYTGGGTKEVIDGLMSSGDVGHFDAGGRLFIDGRDDEMIVSGGENVFPREIEELLGDA